MTAATLERFQVSKPPPEELYDISELGDGIGLTDKGDPRWLLREYLKNAVMSANAKRSSNPDASAVTSEDIYRASIHAWNAYRGQRRLKHLRISLREERPAAR